MKFLYFSISVFLLIAASFLAYSIKRGYLDSTPYLTIIGESNPNDGLGSHPSSIIEAVKDNMKVSHIGTTFIKKRLAGTGVSKETIEILSKKYSKIGKVVLFVDPLYTFNDECNKTFFKTLKSKIKNPTQKDKQLWIAFTVWESDRIPYRWVELLNEKFDALIVPDSSLVEVYKRSGVNKPIFVAELPVDLNPYLNLPIKKERNKKFVFSSLGSYLDRKNQLTLIRAFSKEFKNNPDVFLYMNGRYGVDSYKTKLVEEIKKLGLSNIRLGFQSLPRDEYINILLNTDCLVNVSKGEGYSIQPREAMAMGIPVILSDNMAQSTICKHKIVRPVECDETGLFFRSMEGETNCFDGVNFECSVESVANSLRQVYENYDSYLENSESARNWSRQFLVESLSWKYQSLLMPSKVIFANSNRITKDGIETNSEELIRKFEGLLD